MNMKINGEVVRKTSCRNCATQCGVLVHVKNGEVAQIEGDPENPIGRGKLCIKAAASLDIHKHPSRLNYPLKRAGERGQGKWQRISWKQAMDEIAAEVGEIKRKYGPEAVAYMGGTMHEPGDWAAWRWCNLFGTPNVHNQGKNCGEAEFLAECATYGYHTWAAPKPGVTKCLVLWGSNPSSSGPVGVWPNILETKAKGSKLIVIDPRFTETASKADLWLQLRPGTDGALGLGFLNVIIRENLYDIEFVEKYCLGFDEIRALAEQYPPEKVEGITWVAKEKIIEAARSIAKIKPSLISFGLACGHLGRAAKSAVQTKTILRAITGNLDTEGGNGMKEPFRDLAWFESIQWDRLLEHPEMKHDSVSADMFPIASVKGYRLFREAMKEVYPQGYASAMFMLTYSGINLWDAVIEGKPYPVKVMITQASNPLCTLDTRGCYKALKSENLELHVAMDLFMTPTAMLADYVLPAADWLERPNLVFGWALRNNYVAGEQSVPPLYERRDDYQFWRELGTRLGQETEWPETLEKMYDKFLVPTGKTFNELVHQKEHWSFPMENYRKYEKKGFATFSGKVELLPSIFSKLGIDPLPKYEESARSPIRTPDLASQYPLILIGGARVVNYWHSCYREQKKLRKSYPNPLLQIHPETASKLGIAQGDWVYIETPEGRIKQQAELTEGIHPKVVHADGYWSFPEKPAEEPSLFGVWDSNVNVLVPARPEFCDYAGDYPFRGLLCKVYKQKD